MESKMLTKCWKLNVLWFYFSRIQTHASVVCLTLIRVSAALTLLLSVISKQPWHQRCYSLTTLVKSQAFLTRMAAVGPIAAPLPPRLSDFQTLELTYVLDFRLERPLWGHTWCQGVSLSWRSHICVVPLGCWHLHPPPHSTVWSSQVINQYRIMYDLSLSRISQCISPLQSWLLYTSFHTMALTHKQMRGREFIFPSGLTNSKSTAEAKK